MMTEFDRQIGFNVTRSPFHLNLSIRWFTDLMLVLVDLDSDGTIDTGSLHWQQQAAVKIGIVILSRYIEIKSVEFGKEV